MTHQTWKFRKAIRPLFADPVWFRWSTHKIYCTNLFSDPNEYLPFATPMSSFCYAHVSLHDHIQPRRDYPLYFTWPLACLVKWNMLNKFPLILCLEVSSRFSVSALSVLSFSCVYGIRLACALIMQAVHYLLQDDILLTHCLYVLKVQISSHKKTVHYLFLTTKRNLKQQISLVYVLSALLQSNFLNVLWWKLSIWMQSSNFTSEIFFIIVFCSTDYFC